MENYNNNNKHNNTSRIWSGLIILAVGLVFLLKNVGIHIPNWVISWHTLLIVIGLLIGYKRKFNGGGWLIMITVGGFFTVEDIGGYDLSKYYFAILFIALGLFMIFKPKSAKSKVWKAKWRDKFGDFDQRKNAGYVFNDKEDNDVLDSVNVFGGSHQNIYSKNFKGGDVMAIFGGADINLTQADFQNTIVLDIVAIFGGMKIIVPPGWEIKSEITAIFGGVDDKRAVNPPNSDDRKILIIKGVALFGGVDIRNF